jgi:hemerythrin
MTMGSFITWNDKYNTGNLVIDYQHQRLVRLINDLEEVSRQDELKVSLLDVIFDEIENYARYHFKTEEDIMEKANYSEKEEHKKMHQDFAEKLSLFKAEYRKGSKNVDRDLCLYLKYWLMEHILKEDPKIISEITLAQGMV